jgi:16S rRNA processing protein RimM
MVDDKTADITVGRVGPPRGVRGHLFVQPMTDTPEERFAAGSVLRTEPADAGPLTIAEMSMSGGKLVILFEGVESRSDGEALRGVRLVISPEERAPIDDPDEFYDTDLVGLAARTVGGVELGPVREVLHAGGADYLVLNVAGVERLVPFVSALVPTVDVAGGVVVIDPPEGLFEL